MPPSRSSLRFPSRAASTRMLHCRAPLTFAQLGRTESIKDKKTCSFAKSFEITYFFEERQEIKFAVYAPIIAHTHTRNHPHARVRASTHPMYKHAAAALAIVALDCSLVGSQSLPLLTCCTHYACCNLSPFPIPSPPSPPLPPRGKTCRYDNDGKSQSLDTHDFVGDVTTTVGSVVGEHRGLFTAVRCSM